MKYAPREKCPYLKFFWTVFSHIWRYGVSLRIQPEYGKIQIRKNPNTDTFHVVMTNIALFSTNQIRDIFYSSGNDVYGVKIGKKRVIFI